MIKVGLTGGIGSGKSLISSIFKYLDVPVYDTDSRAKMLMNTDSTVKSQLVSLLGTECYGVDGFLNRAFIADKVFNDAILLEKLNKIVHPAVQKDFLQWSMQFDCAYVVEEAAILYESGADAFVDNVIMVCADKDRRVKRVMARDGVTQEQVESRINNQMSDDEKIKRADFLIDNNETELLIPQILLIHQKLQSNARSC